MKKFIFSALGIIALLGLLFQGSAAFAATAPDRNVLDAGHVFTASQEETLTSALHADDRKYGLVFVVDTVTSLKGQSISDYALQRSNSLGVGDAGKDNGVLMVIAKNDHQVWFELGSGVTGKVSDSEARDAASSQAVPAFRNGDFYTGTVNSVASIGQDFVAKPAPADSGKSTAGPVKHFNWALYGFWAAVVGGIIVGLILFAVAFFMIRNKRDEIKAQKERERNNERSRIAVEIAGDLWEPSLSLLGKKPITAEVEDSIGYRFAFADNQTARKEVMEPLLAKYLTDEAAWSADAAYELVIEKYMNAFLEDAASFSKNPRFRPNATDDYRYRVSGTFYLKSVMQELESFRELSAEDAQHRAQQAKLRKEREAEAARKAKIAEQERKKQEKEAAKIWNGLSAEQKSSVKKAQTKKQKVAALASAVNNDSFNASTFFPILLGLYASEIGHPQSSSSYSSSSDSSYSHRSDSSSYSSPSTDFSSFGGGSFDGGGGGSSW